eukprot:CAMPEP_0177198340 /NCGR_PEP_ID=MMETSP0367-20130122/25081_1 /TAXON_ID=447022 ORGANISM="Scrippsiella hangoei-like, Strain SHHI-4" /NCGR_SAMPLE_ID=MMETSP0367 /ASSEMBLY_ACC=CAM_ASM_000362 /LENGTH=32 /DNA_ID= /DNA_START= /DNA_END= /DNA_ORIENTATION=
MKVLTAPILGKRVSWCCGDLRVAAAAYSCRPL